MKIFILFCSVSKKANEMESLINYYEIYSMFNFKFMQLIYNFK